MMIKDDIKVLIVDDDEGLLQILSSLVAEIGDYKVIATVDPYKAVEYVRTEHINVVLTDIIMPEMDGLEVLEQVRKIDPNISVIMMTGQTDPRQMRKAIKLDAFDFLRKPFDLNEAYLTIKQGVEKNQLLIQNMDYKAHLESMVEMRTLELYEARGKLERSYLNTIYSLVNALEATDIYTRGHSERVTIYSILLARILRFDVEDLKLIRIGAMLHDIGKIGIYDNLLRIDRTLTNEEYDLIKQHPIIGGKIISPVGLPNPVHEIILQHHEWINGYGYPYGIKNDEISTYSRVVSIADAFDAMTSHRAYRDDLSWDSAFKEILDGSDIQFDANFARVFFNEKNRILTQLEDKDSISELLYGNL